MGTDPARPDDLTEDAFLAGRLRLRQFRRGHRSGHDAILLASAVPAHAGERVIEFGAGAGAAGLALARRVEKIVTVSEFSRRRIIDRVGADPAKVVVIGNGVAEDFRPQPPEAIACTRAALGLPARYFLLQATSDRRKNLAGALRAWRSALPSLPEELWLVVSGNPARAHVFGAAEATEPPPRTLFVGYVSDERLVPLMAGAEAFLFPSLYEGFGLPIVEAMACGTAVLTSDATATKEVAGDAAVLVDPAADASIAKGLVDLANDAALRARLSEAGLRHAACFSWDDAARRYLALFEETGCGVDDSGK